MLCKFRIVIYRSYTKVRIQSYFSGIEIDPRRDIVGYTIELSAGNMRVDERMLEERPKGEIAIHRHIRPFEKCHHETANGQLIAQTTSTASDCRPSELENNLFGRNVGRR